MVGHHFAVIGCSAFHGRRQASKVTGIDAMQTQVYARNGMALGALLTALLASPVQAQAVFGDGFEDTAPRFIPATAVAPWPVLHVVDALQFSSRNGLSTVWGSFWETSESIFGTGYFEQSQELGNPTSSNQVSYADLDLGDGVGSLMLRVSVPLGSVPEGARAEVRLGSMQGPLVGNCTLPSTGGAESYRTVGCALDPAQARGRQTLVFRFQGNTSGLRFNWFAYYATGTLQAIDSLQKRQSTSMANAPAPILAQAGQPVRSAAMLPPENLPRAHTFGQWSPARPWECPRWMHDTYWVEGDDGKAYPTWHPPVDFDPETRRYCTYGHEHGDDPRGSAAFAVVGLPPFGYVNEQHSPGNPALQRREDHVGHKVLVANGWRMYRNSDGRDERCNVVVKLHMGTHSADALVNTAHEVFMGGQCEGQQPFHIRQFALFGAPGSFKEAEAPGCNQQVSPGLPAQPANQPTGGVHRAIPTRDCFLRGGPVDQSQNVSARTVEFWLSGMLGGDLYAAVHNPARIYTPEAPNRIARTVDLCYQADHPLADTLACQATVAASPTPLAWDDPRSFFRGTRHFGHHFSALRFQDSANSILYTNAYGQNARATPDPSQGITVRQRVPTSGFYFRVDGHLSLFPDVDYGAGGRNGVRAPN